MRMDKKGCASWKTLADEKEKEWKSILESRIEALEKECKEKDNQLLSEKAKFNELKEHFKYNLKLLEERDRELQKYDVSHSELHMTLNSKNAEISELKIHLDDLKNVIKREERIREELQTNYQKRLREKQAQVDSYKSSKDGEIQDERKDYEEFRRNLQLQLLNVQNELETQKSELTIDFENALKKREHEFRVQFDELNAKALEHEFKAKVLEKELELTRESNDKTSALAEESETTQRKLEKLVKQKEWELANSTALKDSQIDECQNKLASCESAMKRMQEDFQRKYTEMDKLARDRESTMERSKNGFLEREQAMQAVIQDLQAKLEDGQIRERQLTWSNEDLMKGKEMEIEKLHEELNEVKEKWSRHVADMSRDNVTRDLEHGSALEEQRRLKLELEQRKNDLQRYRNELKAAADREEKLDKAKTQAELDWQKRCEDLESQQYDKSEELIRKLITARNEAQALIKERERELRNKVLLIKSLHKERDQLRTLLKKHDISLDSFTKFSLDDSEEEEKMDYVDDLQRQNASLKELIGQMRLQMESLGFGSQKGEAKSTVGNGSVYDNDIQELRKENRELREKLKSYRKVVTDTSQPPTVRDSEQVLSQVEGNSTVKNHILALNSTIGALRSEKVELAATVKKQQAKIAYLENSLEEVSKQPRQKQIQIDQLSYELNSCRHRHEMEITGLKNRVSELEYLLSEARREADEYHRASLERNDELVALGNQLSALKMEMTESSPSINFGAQELYIQQLQDELSQLRKRASALDLSDEDNINSRLAGMGNNSSATDLKHKLRMAAARIVHLAKENQQLIESNNRLRADLKVAIAEKGMPAKPNHEMRFGDNKSVDEMKVQNRDPKISAAQDRLQQLEKLQYQLTRKELQFAHKFKDGQGGGHSGRSHSNFEYTQVPERDTSEPPVKDHTQNKAGRSAEVKMNLCETDPQMLVSFSSGGGDSIQKVWQMLDGSSSSAGPSTPRSPPRDLSGKTQQTGTQQLRKSDGGDDFYLEGHPVPTEVKPQKEHSSRNTGMMYTEKQKKLVKPKPKVRNYNVKENSSGR